MERTSFFFFRGSDFVSVKKLIGQKKLFPKKVAEAYIMAIVMMLYKASVWVMFFCVSSVVAVFFLLLLCMTCMIYYHLYASNDFFFKKAFHMSHQQKSNQKQVLQKKTNQNNHPPGMFCLFPSYRPAAIFFQNNPNISG